MKLRDLVFGTPKSPLDPKVFERLALVAFLAWVGLGADGLSSSCYGPELIFIELGEHQALAPILIVAIAVTVAILSTAYANTIESFPGGGGAYIVATRSLGPYSGLLCGCALIVDYVLTIAISMAAGIEALFSALPPSAQPFKLWAAIGATLVLTGLNLRGIKESILVLLPIFIGFLVTHVVAIAVSLAFHGSGVTQAIANSAEEANAVVSTLGWGGLIMILLRAYTVGSGTYTGIEALSNSVPILKEPRVATAKRTMLYMGVSLAVTSGGLLLGYLLYSVGPEEGKTLNAVFLERLTEGSILEGWFVPVTLLTEGLLLFVAAQAGYVSGPRALASMATDSWVPRWFRHLSNRLVISNGVLLIGGGAIGTVILTGGNLETLVVIYAFSVFITFLFSQLGMCLVHWRHREPGWIGRTAFNASAFLISALVVVFMVVFRFDGGVWAAVLAILLLMGACLLLRRYYGRVSRLLGRLDRVRVQIESEPPRGEPPPRDPQAPTAVVLVRGYNGAGIHTLLMVLRLFPNQFRQFVFISVGDIDFDRFKGAGEVERLGRNVEEDLRKYVALTHRWGYAAESRHAMGVDVADEVAGLSSSIAKEYPRSIFFAGHLVYEKPTLLTRFLHDETGYEIQRRLQFEGLTVILLPIRVLTPRPPALQGA